MDFKHDELLGAIARGWCHPKNAHKVMDPDLAYAIAEEVRTTLAAREDGWRPIESAPDMETMLVCGWNSGKPACGHHILVATKFRGRIVDREASDPNIDIGAGLAYITHWQPLPAAPQPQAGEK